MNNGYRQERFCFLHFHFYRPLLLSLLINRVQAGIDITFAMAFKLGLIFVHAAGPGDFSLSVPVIQDKEGFKDRAAEEQA